MCIVPLMCSCGVQSITQQDYTDLSLDLIPGSSVEEMLQMYQKVRSSYFHCFYCTAVSAGV